MGMLPAMRTLLPLLALLATPAFAKPDADTRAWLARTAELSSDAMEGRDAGSPGHARAIDLVETWFKDARLQPAGENGSFRQTVPLHEVRVTSAEMRVVAPDGSAAPLRFLHDITPRSATDLPATLSGAMRFAGYCSKAEAGPELKGKIAVCYGSRRSGRANAAERLAAVTAAGAIALLTVDDGAFSIEPPRWPDAYARSVAHEGAALPTGLPQFRVNGTALATLIAGSQRLAAAILTDAGLHRDLESFDVPGRFEAKLTVAQRSFTSQQLLGLLPGTDPAKANEVLLLGAHIDGYGFGEPVNGDGLYNGTLDDAGYVALLSQLATRRKGSKGPRGFARPVLFAAWTAEEKGLLGARWWLAHPTVPKEQLAGVINLDQLRPLFPLKALTLHGLGQNTLADTAKAVAESLKIEIRPDREPERNLIRRVDSWPFMEAGVPAVNFIFAYNPRTEEERLYRDWYNRRYHRPQDDISTPMDLDAARDFNRFFYTLVETAANAAARPMIKAGQ